jgi:hypothetical protein
METYYQCLNQYTQQAFQSQNRRVIAVAQKLCFVWHRVNFEATIENVDSKEQLEELGVQIIKTNLDCNLHILGVAYQSGKDGDSSDQEEQFEES